MVGTIISGVVGAGAQIGSAIAGAVASSKVNKEADELREEQKAADDKYYQDKLNEDYLARSENQAVINKTRELLEESNKQARAVNVVAGGTDEQLALQKRQANEVLGDTMSSIAANASSWKDGIERQWRATNAAYYDDKINLLRKRADAIANAAAQAGQAAGSAGMGLAKLFAGKTTAPTTVTTIPA